MSVHTFMVIFILGTASSNGAPGVSYSKVYVERDIPVEYYQYGPPLVSNAHMTELNSAPVQITLPSVSGLVSPCEVPCIIPSQAVASLTPNVLTYKSPVANVPVVVTSTKDEPTGYEYSYVVYDDNTGDHKTQRELSDGLVVRGEYSFIQPDGYIREVQYEADDVKGFNAVVKNFLPVIVENKKKVETIDKKEIAQHCQETKSESIKQGPVSEVESLDKGSQESKQESEESSREKSDEINEKNLQKESKELSKEQSEKSSIDSNVYNPKKESKEVFESSEGGLKNSKEVSKPKSDEDSKKESSEKSNHENEPSKTEFKESSKEESKEKSKESSEEELKTQNKTESEEKPNENFNVIVKNKPYESYTKPDNEIAALPHGSIVSYNDIIRCVQAAINRANDMSPGQVEPSPLTYIILNKPC